METYLSYWPILKKNGKKYLITWYDWATITLSKDRLDLFDNDVDAFIQNLAALEKNNQIVVQAIFSESAPYMMIGTQLIIKNKIAIHRVYPKSIQFWLDEMLQDPNLIYQLPIKKS
jgi:hypothetical protein